jgi:putative membrane-bound dehydrogenase-like protein
MPHRFVRLWLLSCLGLAPPAARADAPRVPDGFAVRLLASVPAVEYPCQVATAPGDDLFVAEDPMDQRGPYEAFDGKILLFRPDREPCEFATGFRAIQGMAWFESKLFVCHMPFLTIVGDTDGDGKADFKQDLFRDLGPTANQGLNDHIVSGIQFGIDGWLYISVGDKGVPGATRPEDGQKVQLKGGGVLRCRPDGTGLEVFSSGTRNHLEANLDDVDRVFTYDNTDDGDGWWTRVTHHIDGGYYGYPYDYHDRPDRFLSRMAEYGGGSPCGAVFYREDAWPEAYRGIGLWAEWGKGMVHAFRFAPRGASFEVTEAIDFALPGTANEFRPIDLAVSDDGRTLYIADWNMGGWGNKNERVGRVWAVSPSQPISTRPRGSDSDPFEAQIAALDHPSYNERVRAQRALTRKGSDVLPILVKALARPDTPIRAKIHLVWAIDGIAGGTPEASLPLIEVLKTGEIPVRVQAARALGDRRVPIASTALVAQLGSDSPPTLKLQALTALGRIGDPEAVPAVLQCLTDTDPYVAFSARVALRRIGDWDTVATRLANDHPPDRVRAVIHALDGVYHPRAVELLLRLSGSEAAGPESGWQADSAQRADAIRAVAGVARKAPPWDGRWWGTRPSQGGPPKQTEAWEPTARIDHALAGLVNAPEAEIRRAAIDAARINPSPDQRAALRGLLTPSKEVDEVRLAIHLLSKTTDRESLGPLTALVRSAEGSPALRVEAIRGLDALAGADTVPIFLELLTHAGPGADESVALIEALGRRKAEGAFDLLKERLGADDPQVRSAAVRALARIGKSDGLSEPLLALTRGRDERVRAAAIAALGSLRIRDAVPSLIGLANEEATRFDATRALAAIADARALRIYLRGLTDKNPDVRREVAEAVSSIRDEVAPVLEQLADRKELPPSVVPELRKIYASLQPVRSWHLIGPLARDNHARIDPELPVNLEGGLDGLEGRKLHWSRTDAVDDHGQINLSRVFGGDQRKAYGYAELPSSQARRAEMVVGSDDTLTVWLNGKPVYDFQGERGFAHGQDRVEVELSEGVNRLLVECGNAGGGWQFAIEVSAASDHSFLRAPAAGAFDSEAFARLALEAAGDPAKGRVLFDDLKGLACIKCHKVKGQGGDVGPDLSGIGAKYPRPQLIESILYPSAQIFSGYEPVVIATTEGQLLTGILKRDDGDAITLQDGEARTVTVRKSEIEERRVSDVSLMPTGLAEGLTREDFADLVRYLETLRDAAPTAPLPATP